MKDAERMAAGNPVSGSLVCAGFQTEGRGRIPGRRWIGRRGESLLFTVIFRTEDIPFELTLFPFFAGCAVSEALEKLCGIRSQIKWPNDIIAHGGKLSGIYCEMTDGFILCGIGINILQDTFETDSKFPPCSVRSLTGKAPENGILLQAVLETMQKNLSDPDWRARGEKILFRLGDEVLFAPGAPGSEELVRGKIAGLGEYGQLIMELPDGNRTDIYSGEIYL